MSEINTGGAAFPVLQLERGGEVVQKGSAGLTMRDYFAGQALVTLTETGMAKRLEVSMVAKAAYELADAMIKARGEQ